MCPPNAFTYGPNGVAFTGDDAQRPLGGASALALIRSEVAALNGVAAGLVAADLVIRCQAIVNMAGAHAAAISLLGAAADKARAGDAPGARTLIGSAAVAVLLAPSLPAPGVYL